MPSPDWMSPPPAKATADENMLLRPPLLFFASSDTEDISDLTCFTFEDMSEISALYLTIASPSTVLMCLFPLWLYVWLPLSLPARPLFPVDRTQSTHGIQWPSCARRIHRV